MAQYSMDSLACTPKVLRRQLEKTAKVVPLQGISLGRFAQNCRKMKSENYKRSPMTQRNQTNRNKSNKMYVLQGALACGKGCLLTLKKQEGNPQEADRLPSRILVLI